LEAGKGPSEMAISASELACDFYELRAVSSSVDTGVWGEDLCVVD
jgi:hypothetical protein